jgi:hypothetical protein
LSILSNVVLLSIIQMVYYSFVRLVLKLEPSVRKFKSYLKVLTYSVGS